MLLIRNPASPLARPNTPCPPYRRAIVWTRHAQTGLYVELRRWGARKGVLPASVTALGAEMRLNPSPVGPDPRWKGTHHNGSRAGSGRVRLFTRPLRGGLADIRPSAACEDVTDLQGTSRNESGRCKQSLPDRFRRISSEATQGPPARAG
jgi:hypothetical protein